MLRLGEQQRVAEAERGDAGVGRPLQLPLPGLEPTEIRDSGDGSTSSAPIGNSGGLGDGQMSLNPRSGGGNGAVTLEVEGTKVGVSAVDETHTLRVRAKVITTVSMTGPLPTGSAR
jgi:general secretion pathway protein D